MKNHKDKEGPKAPIRAAQYVRMSTEHQKYSTENQQDMIKEFADAHNMVVVQTYADDGKSGLNIDGRKSLKKLIYDVENEHANFSVILVYDISRWGRFQDADESAYYEHICKRRGVNVQYCAEQFKNDGSPISTMAKSFKRAMAGEYSRELSVKVFKGQCKLIEEGFRQGGSAGFGLRRMLIDQHYNHKGIIYRGEYKSLQTDRVILVPGPPEEVQTVNKIYNMFVEEGKSESDISKYLNSKGVVTDLKRLWTRGTVNQILSNEKYIGNNVYNRSSFKLKKKRVKNPEEMWIRRDGAYEATIDPQLFYKAQGIILERNRKYSDEEMLDRLKELYQKHGKLSGLLIDESEGMPMSTAYISRFKGLIRAYKLIGYTPDRDYQYIQINRHLRKLYPEIISDVIKKIGILGGYVEQDEETDLFFINGEFTASLVLARCSQTPAGSLRWVVRFDSGLEPDITIVSRMDATNKAPMDYYLLPLIDISLNHLRLAENNKLDFDTYRFDNLDYLFRMAEQTSIKFAV
jgi:DNA invertase Pin-like site-specific DNA recombinase